MFVILSTRHPARSRAIIASRITPPNFHGRHAGYEWLFPSPAK
jgi:hypothetical protein